MANLPPTLACERLGLSRIAPFIPIHDALDERVGTLHNFLCLLPLLSQSFGMCCWHQMHNKHTFTRLNIKCTDINQACQKLLAINHNLFLTLFYTVPQLFGNLSCTSIYLSKFMFLYTDMNFKAPKCKELPTRCQRRHWDGGLATSGRSSAVWQWLKYIYIKKRFFRHISWCSSEAALHPRACNIWLEWLTALIKFVCGSLICKKSSLEEWELSSKMRNIYIILSFIWSTMPRYKKKKILITINASEYSLLATYVDTYKGIWLFF